MIKIALVDDHEIFLKGLERLFASYKQLTVLATFTNGQSLLNTLEIIDIDVLLLDVQLPDFEPEELLKSIRILKPNLPILYLTMMRGSRAIKKLEKFDIQGYILKDASINELLEAIENVANGEKYISSDLYIKEEIDAINTTTIPENKLGNLLSPREREILVLICKEYSSAEIGEKLFLSTGTVDTHRRNILVKAGVSNTVGLVKFAIKNGLLENEDN
ncbi:DNA-binding response regulator [Lacihabitans sp. LS3-19]|uniref:response regulator n=1 Tax=Lacihabitans sp. LS3-19 TaxID=2487335 RepID=UPI0020CF8C49|nr:response regulator transcription factor [Lacihabitans sp. LS3-19]MCP9767175.1 DNA-binding response regulator [Lacihabitans sp. LS3-19]